jgi:hypothetical protein
VHHGSGLYSACNINEYWKISGDKARPACKVDSRTAICEPIAWTTWDLDNSQLHRPPWPVAGICLLCVVYIVCNVSFIVDVALCAVFCFSVVCYFV